MAAASILAHRMIPAQALQGSATNATAAKPLDSSSSTSGSSSSSSSSSGDSAVISANDFLTLLVTEMQNQDPTADTDPNEYVDQLVQVNSLEQLIDINQTLTTSLDPSGSTSGSSTDAANGKVSAAPFHTAGQGAISPAPATATHKPAAMAALEQAPGNLSVPAASPAAQRVGHALDGRAHIKRTPTIGRFPAAI